MTQLLHSGGRSSNTRLRRYLLHLDRTSDRYQTDTSNTRLIGCSYYAHDMMDLITKLQ